MMLGGHRSPRVTRGAAGSRAQRRNWTLLLPREQGLWAKEVPPWANGLSVSSPSSPKVR